MKPIDEHILETMRDEGNLTPQALADFDVTVPNYASDRLSVLSRYGMVEKISRGLYRLTDTGKQFLDEELDASTLEPVEDDG
ncbi:ArsR family transcriptional regulator [Halogeometricum borinquense]|uniref:ArsR family transcriptional regulator n=1 Tax=Halogeometricum borinquense TaxID=60847 RepID=A0A6C0UPS7_9EURY|nr:ArsR family transcriptional regulator [Halogeometricum borinquense]